jgi:hypothetical protein
MYEMRDAIYDNRRFFNDNRDILRVTMSCCCRLMNFVYVAPFDYALKVIEGIGFLHKPITDPLSGSVNQKIFFLTQNSN